MLNPKKATGGPKLLSMWLSLVFAVFPLTSCNSQVTQGPVLPPEQAQVIQAQQSHSKHVEVTVVANVQRILPDDTNGLQHQRFIIGLSNGTTVLVAHDLSMAPRIPMQVGDQVKIHGEYIWTDKGGVLHWTHHTDTPRHEGGWIELNALVYQ